MQRELISISKEDYQLLCTFVKDITDFKHFVSNINIHPVPNEYNDENLTNGHIKVVMKTIEAFYRIIRNPEISISDYLYDKPNNNTESSNIDMSTTYPDYPYYNNPTSRYFGDNMDIEGVSTNVDISTNADINMDTYVDTDTKTNSDLKHELNSKIEVNINEVILAKFTNSLDIFNKHKYTKFVVPLEKK